MNITNDRVTSYIEGLYKPINQEFADLRQYAREHRVPIILPDTETLLLNLIRMVRPEAVLEIGAAIGYSAACFATVCSSSRVTTIEADEEAYRIAKENLARMGLSSRVELVFGEAQDVLDSLEGEFDFVFIDAAKSHYREFWDKAMVHLKAGAVIVCDNVLMRAMTVSDEYDPKHKFKTSIRRMREFLQYITQLENVATSVLPVGDGMSVSIIEGIK